MSVASISSGGASSGETAQARQAGNDGGSAQGSVASEPGTRSRRNANQHTNTAAPQHGNAAANGAKHPALMNRYATDDEILGIAPVAAPARANGSAWDANLASGAEDAQVTGDDAGSDAGVQPDIDDTALATDAARENGALPDAKVQAALDASPQLRRAWQDAQSYREVFATPEEARAATALLGDLNHMDALFFSQRPEDHAELARAVASLDPGAFASLAQAMNALAANGAHAAQFGNEQQIARTASRGSENKRQDERAAEPAPFLQRERNDNVRADAPPRQSDAPSPAQMDFLHAANAAAVQGVLDAIETQVERLLPEGVSKTARNRVVGEIYRELDGSLAANRELGQQMRDAFRSGSLDAAHQRAVVTLVTGRARQALPGIAKRVLNEWTSTVVAANQDRLARQRAAAHRVDIAGSGRGGDSGRRPVGPRDIDYGRMSDSDILNL